MHVRHIPLHFVPMFVQNSENIYLSYYQRIRIKRYIYMDNCVIGSRKSSKQQKKELLLRWMGMGMGKTKARSTKNLLANDWGPMNVVLRAIVCMLVHQQLEQARGICYVIDLIIMWFLLYGEFSIAIVVAKPSQVKPNVLFTHMQTHLKYVNRFLFSCSKNIPALSCEMQYST